MSLAEQIAALNDPAPSYDPEDASDTETKAKIAEFDEEFEDIGEAKPSQLRRRAAGVLADEDRRYAGRTTSRKNLDLWDHDDVEPSPTNERSVSDSDDDDLGSGDNQTDPDSDNDMSDDDMSDDDNSDISGERRRTQSIEDAFKKIRQELDEESSDGEEDDDNDFDNQDNDDFDEDSNSDEDDDSDSDDSKDEDEDYHSNEETGGVQAFASVSVEEEVAKGQATKAQLTLWDSFIENRIKLQKALAIANQLPAHDKQAAFVQAGGQAVQDMLHSSSQQLKKLLKKLIELQQALLLGNPATRHIVEGTDAAKQSSDSDEEITSSDEDGESSSPPSRPRKTSARKPQKRKADIGDVGDFLAKRHKEFEAFQYDTIQKWHDKTRLATGKSSAKSFASFEKSAVTQIHQVLQDKPRLIKRTQLRRTVYTRLGDTEEINDATTSSQNTQEGTGPGNSHLKDFDEETFDDDDFYHQLLRELIEKRTSSTTDPVQLTRQWLEVQKLRRKIKKKVDTRASKGRKIRYDVHPQLVSFMAGRDTGTMMESAKSELFNSLFGKRPSPAEVIH